MTGKRRNSQKKSNNGYTNRRQKNPFDSDFGEYKNRHKVKPQKGKVRYSKDTRLQKQLLKQVKRIAKNLGLRPAREIGTGVDFYQEFKRNGKNYKIPIDFKFAFGMHFGEEHIKARITPKESGKRRLINESKWTFAADANGQMHVFKTSALEKYIRENYGRIKKSDQIDKINYVELPINVSDMLYTTKSKSLVVPFNQSGIRFALKFIADAEAGEIKKAPKYTKIKPDPKNKSNGEPKKPEIKRRGIRKK